MFFYSGLLYFGKNDFALHVFVITYKLHFFVPIETVEKLILREFLSYILEPNEALKQ